MTAIEWAPAYVEHGCHVFPVTPRGKRPLEGLLHGKDDASTDQEQIREWFADHADRNIGIACGPSNLVVIDVDLPKEKNNYADGRAELAALVATLGELPSTPTADTGSGGVHMLFRAPVGVDLLGHLGHAIDVIRNGYIVAPPSVHESGGVYRWRGGMAPDEIAVAELPLAWIERLRRRVSEPPPLRGTEISDELRSRRASAYLAKMPEAIAGNEGSLACWNAIAAAMIGFDLPRSDAERLIVNEYNQRCDPPWSERELAHKFDDVERKCDRPRGYLLGAGATSVTSSPVREVGPDSPTSPADPFVGEVADALAEVRAKLSAAGAARGPLFQTDAVELLARTFDGARWLVTGLVTRGGITMIGAEPKSIKTWLATELAIAVASGTKALGEFFAEAGRVAYFYAEDMDYQVRNRVRAMLASANRTIEAGRLFLQPRGMFLDILRDEDLAWIVASVRRLGAIDLLLLDPLRDIHAGEEDKSDSMRDVMRRLRVLAELLGCTIVVVHHAPKSNKENAKRRPGQNLRGSSAIHGAVDSGLYLESNGGDGITRFASIVTSQVKGARSAGRFRVELEVTDDEHGQAVEARWTYSRGAAVPASNAPPTTKQADDLMVAAWVRAQPMPMTRTALRKLDSRPIGEKRVTAALERLIDAGILVVQGGFVVAPRQVQTECNLDA